MLALYAPAVTLDSVLLQATATVIDELLDATVAHQRLCADRASGSPFSRLDDKSAAEDMEICRRLTRAQRAYFFLHDAVGSVEQPVQFG